MTAMKELRAYWPVCTWIFHLFTKIIKERPTTLVPKTVDVFDVGGWSEIEEFSSMLGLDFDFNQVFDAGFFDLGTADYAVSESPMNVNITENSFHGFLPG